MVRSSSGNLVAGGAPGSGSLDRSAPVCRGLELGVGVHLEGIDPVAEPLPGRAQKLGRGCLAHAIEPHLIEVGPPHEDLPQGQHVRLATEPADPLDPADEPGPVLRLHPAQLGRRGAAGEKPSQLLIHRLLHPGQIDAGTGGGLDGEHAADLAEIQRGRDVGGDLVVIDQPLVEPGRLAAAEHIAHQVQIVLVRRAPARDVPDLVDPRLRDPVLHDPALASGPLGDPGFLPGHRRPRGYVAEVFLYFLLCGLGIDVSCHHDHRVGGAVVGPEPFLDVVQLGGIQVFHGADGGPGIRMVWRVELGGEEVPHLAIRLVLSLALLVLHHTPLLIQLRLADGAGQMAHAVGFHL